MKFRTKWYREQEQQRAMMISKPAGRKRRPPANAPETWAKLRSISIKLNETLHDLLEIMHQPAPGERAPEISVTLITDFAESPPPTIEPPARCKPVNPMGRHRIAVGGKVEANTVLARIEVSAKVVVWAAPGEAPPAEMSRRTWILPLESAEKQEKRYEKLQDGK
jgi:hypothetical protein